MLGWCLKQVYNDLVLTYWSLRLLQGPLVHDVSEHGQQEGDGFPAAGLSDANEVAARHDGRDGLGLDGSGLIVALSVYICEEMHEYEVWVSGQAKNKSDWLIWAVNRTDIIK